jgi:hypothetical protein
MYAVSGTGPTSSTGRRWTARDQELHMKSEGVAPVVDA